MLLLIVDIDHEPGLRAYSNLEDHMYVQRASKSKNGCGTDCQQQFAGCLHNVLCRTECDHDNRDRAPCTTCSTAACINREIASRGHRFREGRTAAGSTVTVRNFSAPQTTSPRFAPDPARAGVELLPARQAAARGERELDCRRKAAPRYRARPSVTNSDGKRLCAARSAAMWLPLTSFHRIANDRAWVGLGHGEQEEEGRGGGEGG